MVSVTTFTGWDTGTTGATPIEYDNYYTIHYVGPLPEEQNKTEKYIDILEGLRIEKTQSFKSFCDKPKIKSLKSFQRRRI